MYISEGCLLMQTIGTLYLQPLCVPAAKVPACVTWGWSETRVCSDICGLRVFSTQPGTIWSVTCDPCAELLEKQTMLPGDVGSNVKEANPLGRTLLAPGNLMPSIIIRPWIQLLTLSQGNNVCRWVFMCAHVYKCTKRVAAAVHKLYRGKPSYGNILVQLYM